MSELYISLGFFGAIDHYGKQKKQNPSIYRKYFYRLFDFTQNVPNLRRVYFSTKSEIQRVLRILPNGMKI